MTKRQLIDLVARKAHLTKRGATEAVDVFLNEIGRVLSKGEKVVLSGFGTFRVISMKGNTASLRLRRLICAETGFRATISRKIAGRWRLIGYGIIK